MQKQIIVYVALGLVVLNVLIAALYFTHTPGELRSARKSSSPELTQPRWAAEKVQSKALFFTPAAKAMLQAQQPELVRGTDERAFAQAAQNPTLFRQLDHARHFDAVLLSGDPSVYRPLLQHLLDSRDWTLSYLDHTSLIFSRAPAAPWREDSLDAMKQKFSGWERAIFLTQSAGKLLAVGKPALAKRCLDEALALDKSSPETWAQLAVYDGQIGRWAEALAHVDKALALDKNNAAALATKAQILFGAKRFDEALEISKRVVELNPDDPATLFLYAKISHEAHAYYREIDALQKLIALAEKQQQPVSGYRIYLGQAYAAKGDAQPAVEQFEKVVAADDVTPAQRTYARECIERIKSRAAM